MTRRPFTAAAVISMLMAVLLALGAECMPRRMTLIPLNSTHFIVLWNGVVYLCDLNRLYMDVPLQVDADLFVSVDHLAAAFAVLPLAWFVVAYGPDRRRRTRGFPVGPIRQK